MLFLAAATLAAVWYLFRFTTLGRRLLATGGNEKAAKMAAVDTDRMQLIANILSGLFAAVAGICTVSMNGAAQPTTGQDWMIYSFAVSVIGGTALAGGVICPIGIAIAAFLVVIIKNGLVKLNATSASSIRRSRSSRKRPLRKISCWISSIPSAAGWAGWIGSGSTRPRRNICRSSSSTLRRPRSSRA